MADTDLSKAMAGAGMSIGDGDQSEKENNGEGGLKPLVNGKERIAFC